MKAIHTSLLVATTAIAFASTGAFAQLKAPPSTGKSAPAKPAPAASAAPAPAASAAPAPAASAAPAPAASAAAAAEPTPEAKEKAAAATLAASGWLILLDRRDWGRAWETSAAMFRSSVPLATWMEGIPKARDLGEFVEREPEEAVYKTVLEGRPNGNYVTIFYSSKFSKKADVVEIVTTVREPDGKWRVTGYSTR